MGHSEGFLQKLKTSYDTSRSKLFESFAVKKQEIRKYWQEGLEKVLLSLESELSKKEEDVSQLSQLSDLDSIIAKISELDTWFSHTVHTTINSARERVGEVNQTSSQKLSQSLTELAVAINSIPNYQALLAQQGEAPAQSLTPSLREFIEIQEEYNQTKLKLLAQITANIIKKATDTYSSACVVPPVCYGLIRDKIREGWEKEKVLRNTARRKVLSDSSPIISDTSSSSDTTQDLTKNIEDWLNSLSSLTQQQRDLHLSLMQETKDIHQHHIRNVKHVLYYLSLLIEQERANALENNPERVIDRLKELQVTSINLNDTTAERKSMNMKKVNPDLVQSFDKLGDFFSSLDKSINSFYHSLQTQFTTVISDIRNATSHLFSKHQKHIKIVSASIKDLQDHSRSYSLTQKRETLKQYAKNQIKLFKEELAKLITEKEIKQVSEEYKEIINKQREDLRLELTSHKQKERSLQLQLSLQIQEWNKDVCLEFKLKKIEGDDTEIVPTIITRNNVKYVVSQTKEEHPTTSPSNTRRKSIKTKELDNATTTTSNSVSLSPQQSLTSKTSIITASTCTVPVVAGLPIMDHSENIPGWLVESELTSLLHLFIAQELSNVEDFQALYQFVEPCPSTSDESKKEHDGSFWWTKILAITEEDIERAYIQRRNLLIEQVRLLKPYQDNVREFLAGLKEVKYKEKCETLLSQAQSHNELYKQELQPLQIQYKSLQDQLRLEKRKERKKRPGTATDSAQDVTSTRSEGVTTVSTIQTLETEINNVKQKYKKIYQDILQQLANVKEKSLVNWYEKQQENLNQIMKKYTQTSHYRCGNSVGKILLDNYQNDTSHNIKMRYEQVSREIDIIKTKLAETRPLSDA